MKKILRTGLILMMGLLVLTGCGSQDGSADKNTLVYGSQDYTAINPALYEHGEINTLIFAGLTGRDAENHVVPTLASSWEWDQNNLTYTFNLRKNLTFHDGQPLTSADVKFTLEAILDEKNQSEIISNYADIKKISCPNEQTVKIQLTQQNVAFPDYMSIGILPKHLLEGENLATCDFNRNPVGAGPYALTEWDQGQSITMEKFADYYDGEANIEKVIFKIVPDSNAKAIQLESGDIQMAQVTPEAAARMKDNDQYTVYNMDTADYRALAYNFASPLFKENKELPEALSYAIDREAVIKSVLLHEGVAAYSPLQMSVYNDETMEKFSYNPDKTIQQLEQAGWSKDRDGYYSKKGRQLGFTISAMSDDQVRIEMATLCASQLQKIGINAKAEAKPSLDWAGQDSCILGWGSPFDPDDHTYKVFSSGAGDNYTAYANDNVDRVLAQARHTMDNEKRKELYKEFQQELTKAMPYTFIAYVDADYVMEKGITGVTEKTILGHHGVGIFWNIAKWKMEG